jgi:hypothetical protein
MASVPGKRSANITCQVEAKGSGTAGTAPEWGKLLRACGFSETIVPATSVTYAPVSTGDPSLTVGHYIDGVRHQIAGSRGNMQFGGAVGEILVMNYDFLGVEDTVTDNAVLTPTYQTTVPRPLLSMTFTLHGVTTLVGSSFSLDLGISPALRQDFVKASGYISTIVGGRIPVGNFVFEKPLVASKDWYGIMSAGTEAALSVVLGTVAGNIITIAAPKVQITNISEVDDGGIAKLSVDVKMNLTSGDDEISIALT